MRFFTERLPGLNLLPIGITIGSVWFTLQFSVQAQIVPDASLGNENSVVVPNQNIRGINSDRIDGGAVRGGNLFHSFQEFNIDEGRGAYFSNPDNIINILTRVTGGNISEILGTLGILGNANLFLINPNGIVFGPNARLDVGGSFFATTADSILFENGVEFAASNPEAPPLLTINMPLGLNIRENPGAIINQAATTNSNGNVTGLEVSPGNSLLLVGGDVTLDRGGLNAPEGHIELAGVSSAGRLGLSVDGSHLSLSFPENTQFSNVTLANDARASVLGNGGGDIVVNANNFTATNGGRLVAGTEGLGDAGDIIVNASEVSLFGIGESDNGSGLYNAATQNSLGNAGNILIRTQSFRATSGATVFSLTEGVGNAGNIDLISTEFVELSEGEIQSRAVEDSTGNSGNIVINADSVSLLNESDINSSNQFGSGNAGNIEINARNDINVSEESSIDAISFSQGNAGQVTLEASNIQFNNSNIFTGAALASSGRSGDINITANSVVFENGSTITGFSTGNSGAGNITVRAMDFVTLGNDSELSVFASGDGQGGNIFIETGRLSIQTGSSLFANVFGSQPAGNITINASESVEVTGIDSTSSISAPSRISVDTSGDGDGGGIFINTQKLLVSGGAQISTDALRGNGSGGIISINAGESVEVLGTTPDSLGISSVESNTRAGGNGGRIRITTDQLRIRAGGRVSAFTTFESSGQGGIIEINANDFVEVGGTRPISNFPSAIDTGSDGIGNAGEITVTTDQLVVRDGGRVRASTSDEGEGGTLRVNAESVELIGGVIAFPSQLATLTRGNGNAGNLTVNAQNLTLREGAVISAETLGSGQGGTLTVNASNSVNLVGTAGFERSALTTATQNDGAAGNLTVNTQNLTLREGAIISAETSGTGQGGTLTIKASDSINLIGTDFFDASSITTTSSGAGNAGNLTLQTPRLIVQEGASVSASTTNSGQGGTLEVNADQIELLGTSIFRSPSSLQASVNTSDATGTGGTLVINTRRLSVGEGARISTTTQGIGNAGDGVINAGEININGISANSETPSGIFADTTQGSRGDGGSLTLSATELNIRDLGQVTVSSDGTGAAGSLEVNSPFVQLDTQSSLRAETAAGDQGNIILNTSDLRLRNNSQITTNATGVATGGNIEINTDNLIAIEDSDISANAQQAFGGQVIINANAIFGTQFRQQQTGASDITATSELGPDFSGTVELNTEIDPSSGLIELDANVVDPNDLIAQNFCEQGKDSQFIATGRGGLPPSPRDLQTVNLSRVGLIETVPNNTAQNSEINSQQYTISQQQLFENSQTSNNKEQINSETIIPARGWIKTKDGEIILVSYDPTQIGVRRLPYNFNPCQPQLP